MLPLYWILSIAMGQRNTSLTVDMKDLVLSFVFHQMEKQLHFVQVSSAYMP